MEIEEVKHPIEGKKFNLSKEIFDAHVDIIVINPSSVSECSLIKALKVKKAVRLLKERTKLKFPLGCDKQLRDITTTCGDISFGNKIILCDNCTQELIGKFEENEKELDKIFGSKITGEKLT